MRARRATILSSFVLCFTLTVTLVVVALPSDQSESAAPSANGANGLPTAPQIGSDSSPDSALEGGPSSFTAFLAWVGAFASGLGTIVTFVVLRIEVRSQKSIMRAQRNRDQYRRELKAYNAQLRGPPKDNT